MSFKSGLILVLPIAFSVPAFSDSVSVSEDPIKVSQEPIYRNSCYTGDAHLTANRQIKVIKGQLAKDREYDISCKIEVLRENEHKTFFTYRGESVGAKFMERQDQILLALKCRSNDPLHTGVADEFRFPEDPLPSHLTETRTMELDPSQIGSRSILIEGLFNGNVKLMGTYRDSQVLTWELKAYDKSKLNYLPANGNLVRNKIYTKVLDPRDGIVRDGHQPGIELDSVDKERCELFKTGMQSEAQEIAQDISEY